MPGNQLHELRWDYAVAVCQRRAIELPLGSSSAATLLTASSAVVWLLVFQCAGALSAVSQRLYIGGYRCRTSDSDSSLIRRIVCTETVLVISVLLVLCDPDSF